MVDFYLPRVGPQSTTGTLQGSSAGAFGAAKGEAIEEIGDEWVARREREEALDEQYQSTEAGKSIAQFGADMDVETVSARETMPAGGAGYTENLLTSFDKRGEQLLGTIANPKVRERASLQLVQMRARIEGQENAFEAGVRVKKTVADVDDQLRISANRVRSKGDIATFGEVLDQFDTTLAGVRLPDADKRAIGAEGRDRLARSLVEGLAPEQAKAVLEGGTLNDYLKPETLDALLGENGVLLRRLNSEREAAASTGKADAIERINLLMAKVGDGYTPSDEEFAAHDALAKTYSLDVKQWNIGVARTQRDFNRVTDQWTPAQWAAEEARLAAKGDKRSAAEDVNFKMIGDRKPKAVARFNADPHGAAAVAGDPAPAVDWAEPTRAQIEARSVWARSRAQAAGLAAVPYLSKEELDQFRGQACDPAGRLTVATQLRGAFGVSAGTEIARQIDPDNREMQLFVGLPPRTAEWVKDGNAALKIKPGLFDAPTAQRIFGEFAPAIPPEMQAPVFEAAKAIVAAAGNERGVADWKDNEEGFAQSFRSALHRAAGQVGGGEDRTGGFVNWNGRRAWLPQTVGANDFQRRVSRATPEDWLQAGAGASASSAPYYRGANGQLTRLSADHVKMLGKYQLETVNPGVYRMVDPRGGVLADKSGRPWQFDIRRLGQ